MADGVTQPGGGVNPILIQNDADVSAGGDGSYSFADISAVFPALCIDLGTTPKSYRMTVSLTNGDGTAGVGTTTTLKDSNCTVIFDAARTYSVSATGRSTRFTEFGVKVTGTKTSGRSGVRIVAGAALNIGGNGKFYGSIMEAVSGLLTLAPAQAGLVYEVYNCFVSGQSSIVFGNATAAINNAYNVDFIGGSAGAAAISNFNVTTAERITIGINAAALRHIQTGTSIQAKDLVLIGATSSASVRHTGVTAWDLIVPTWDQNVAIVDATNQNTINDWWPYGVAVLDGNAAGISGIPIELDDRTGAAVISTTTNASGMISYGSGITANCVKAASYLSGGTVDYRGPFTLKVNQGAGTNVNWPQRTISFPWPSTATWLTSFVQYQDMFDVIQLVPPGGGPTAWQELQM